MRVISIVSIVIVVAACTQQPQAERTAVPTKPADPQHANITTPHGDHSPHHGGLVLMSGELHYEVVLDRGGRHRIWFTDAVRTELPASVASKVTMTVTRPAASPEQIALEIDESGESWIAKGSPVKGSDVMVKVSYVTKGEPFEIEIPFPDS